MLVEIMAASKSHTINDIVISLFPAGAGMNRLNSPPLSVITTVPRRRGDEPIAPFRLMVTSVCSPQARG